MLFILSTLLSVVYYEEVFITVLSLTQLGLPISTIKGAGFILGKEKFIKGKLNALKNQVESKDFAYRKLLQAVDPSQIIQKAADFYKKEPEALCKARKKPLLAKKIAVYLLMKLTALTNREIGDKFSIGYSGVSWITKDVEELAAEDEKIRKDIEALNLRLKV